MRDHTAYMRDIYEAIKAIDNFTIGMRYDEFEEDDKTASAVIRKFEIVSEASKSIPENVKKRYPEIPWGEMEGLREKLLHSYYSVNYNLIWYIIKNRLPAVKQHLYEIVKPYL